LSKNPEITRVLQEITRVLPEITRVLLKSCLSLARNHKSLARKHKKSQESCQKAQESCFNQFSVENKIKKIGDTYKTKQSGDKMFTKVTILTESELDELKSANPSGVLRNSNMILSKKLQECNSNLSMNMNKIGLKIDEENYLMFSSKEAFNKIYLLFLNKHKSKQLTDQKVLEWFQDTAMIMQCKSSMMETDDIHRIRLASKAKINSLA
jgi:hypothetical protein